MATQTITRFIDDLDSEIEATQTVEFALDGKGYEIDLSDPNAARLRDALAEFIGSARSVGTTTKARRKTAAKPASGLDNKAIRAWAIEQGLKVSKAGRLPDSVIQKYLKRDETPAPVDEAPAVKASPVASPFAAVEGENEAQVTPIRRNRSGKKDGTEQATGTE